MVCFYISFDTQIAVLKCLEPKPSKMYFWKGAGKCKNGSLEYQNENINKLARKRQLSLLKEFFVVLVKFKKGNFYSI